MLRLGKKKSPAKGCELVRGADPRPAQAPGWGGLAPLIAQSLAHARRLRTRQVLVRAAGAARRAAHDVTTAAWVRYEWSCAWGPSAARPPFPCGCGRTVVPRRSPGWSARRGCCPHILWKKFATTSQRGRFACGAPRLGKHCCARRIERLGPVGKH